MGTVAGRMNPGNGTPPMSDTAVTATKIRSSAVIARAATRTALTRRPVASTNTGDAAIVTVDKVFPHVLRISSDSPGCTLDDRPAGLVALAIFLRMQIWQVTNPH
jgi:hypothetical protein